MNKTIYLDYNATTPIAPEVSDAMKPFLDIYFGNPSSTHQYGIEAKIAIEKARNQVASLLGCNSDEVVFTSGGSESNNYAIKGVAFKLKSRGNHIITSSIEHPAVIEVCKYLENNGFEVTYLPVNSDGMVEVESVEKAIRQSTILISIMHANNETGVIQPIAEISKVAKSKGIIFHSDAAQSVGKIRTKVKELGVDLLSVAAHKFYGPKGIGAIYIRNGVSLEKLIHGASHERNHRAGTENILEIAGIGKAAEIADANLEKNIIHFSKHRDLLENILTQKISVAIVNGKNAGRLPNTLSISFPGVEANTLLDEITDVAASAGAACHSDGIDVSTVLEAMRVPVKYAMGTIRFSTGRDTTEDEIIKTANIFAEKIKNMMGEISEAPLQPVDFSDIKLTHFTHGLGCACKLRPQDLEQVLKKLPLQTDPRILVGTDTSDDAAVFRIDDNSAIVQTLDFFTPIVDDPYFFGAIAAANALSDIYAMGAKPLFALNIVGFPDKRLPLTVLEEILRGASDKAKEAGISIIGGHTVEDPEPKYGMVVTGLINPNNILRNIGAKPGDLLVLTKPIGLGIIATATKRGVANEQTRDKAIKTMSMLNSYAAEAFQGLEISACTDVTGFGLMGHLREMVLNQDVDADVFKNEVPVIENAREFAIAGIVPGGTMNNLDWVKNEVVWGEGISRTDQILLCDAQTSGGLLVAINPRHAETYLGNLKLSGIEGWVIGKFKQGSGKIWVS